MPDEFKGLVRVNTTISATFNNNSNSVAQLYINCASGEQDQTTIAPSTSGTVQIVPSSTGVLNVIVSQQNNNDSGVLTVMEDGQILPGSSETVTGNTRWSYNVVS